MFGGSPSRGAVREVEPTPSSVLRPASPFQVLVVDDDPTFAEAVVDMVRDDDIVALAVSDPREALKVAAAQPLAAAVLDLVMPGLDGLELARELRKRRPGLQVVLLTGHVSVQSAIQGIRNDVFDYLQKGTVDRKRLRRAVRAAIARGEEERSKTPAGLPAEPDSRLEALAEAGSRLAAQTDLQGVLTALVAAAKGLVEADSGRVYFVDRNEQGDLVPLAVVGDGSIANGDGPTGLEGIAAFVAETGTPVRLDTPLEHRTYSPATDAIPTERPGLVAVPLSRPGLAGVLFVAGRARPFTDQDMALLRNLAGQGAAAIDLLRSRALLSRVSEALVGLLDNQEPNLAPRSRAIAALVDGTARHLGLGEEERRPLRLAALLHQAGQLPVGLTTNPSSEWSEAWSMISADRERWDGTGAPRGRRGEQIPLGARILAAAATFATMMEHIPCAVGRRPVEALALLEAQAGRQLDPSIVQAFVEQHGGRPPVAVA